MAIDAAFAELMTQTVQVYAPTTRDAYSKSSWSATPSLLTCHVVEKVQTVTGSDGEEKVSQGQVYIFGTSTVDDGYRLILPSGREQPIVAVQTRYDETGGGHHTVIYYG